MFTKEIRWGVSQSSEDPTTPAKRSRATGTRASKSATSTTDGAPKKRGRPKKVTEETVVDLTGESSSVAIHVAPEATSDAEPREKTPKPKTTTKTAPKTRRKKASVISDDEPAETNPITPRARTRRVAESSTKDLSASTTPPTHPAPSDSSSALESLTTPDEMPKAVEKTPAAPKKRGRPKKVVAEPIESSSEQPAIPTSEKRYEVVDLITPTTPIEPTVTVVPAEPPSEPEPEPTSQTLDVEDSTIPDPRALSPKPRSTASLLSSLAVIEEDPSVRLHDVTKTATTMAIVFALTVGLLIGLLLGARSARQTEQIITSNSATTLTTSQGK